MAVSKKLKKIMAEDDRMFQAMSSKQFSRGAIALRTVEQPQKSTVKKKVPRKAARGVSQFTVSPLGVFDALSSSFTASMFPVPQATDKVDASQGDEQGEANESAVSPVPPQASRSEEASPPIVADSQLPQGSRDIESSPVVDSPVASADLEDFDLQPQAPQDLESLFGEIDVSRETPAEVEVESPTEVTSVDEPIDFNTKESREIERLANDEFDVEQEPLTLVQKRRADAESEQAAAARNFSQQRQPPPIPGIPDPVPMQPIRFEGEAAGPNGDEALIAHDRAATQQIEFSESMVSITERMAIEIQALSVRLRNVELLLDRL